MRRSKRTSDASGIYAIVCRANDRIYFGSAASFDDRYRRHCLGLRKGRHSNKNLQADYDLYGKEAFEFVELMIVRGDPSIIEMALLKGVVGQDWCYNILDTLISFKGQKHTDETKAKLRESQLARRRKSGESNPEV